MAAVEVQRWMIPNGMWEHLTIGLPLLAVCAFVARGTASYAQNLVLFVSSVFVASLLFLASHGLMAPAGIAALTLATLLTRTIDAPRTSLACLCLAVIGLLGVGLLHSKLGVVVPTHQTSLAFGGNWFRIAVSVPSIALIGAIAVLQILDAAQSSIVQLVTLEASLTATERLLVQEVQSVTNIDRITARASDLEALGRMTGAVAHDVNNSLQAITAWASTLVTPGNPSTSTAHLEALVAINQAAEHAEALLADLDVSRLGPNQRSVVDVGSETQRVSRLLRALLGSRHLLKIHAPNSAQVVTNAHTFHRALFNLVANARDAMTEPGTCTVSVNCTAGRVCVSVEDDGDGMDEVTRQRLFEAYFTTKGPRGNGLGLCSVTKLLSESNGAVDTWSKLGHGTRITLTLPQAERVAASMQPVLA
jgi:signal transduction histidine kinase